MAETGRYLYAVTTSDLPARAKAGVAGVGGAAIETLAHRGLTAVVSTVSLKEFGEEPLQRNLEQMAWLERTARAHDEVVRWAADHGATAPLRMLTICNDDTAVLDRVDDMYDDLVAALSRIDGRHEWSIKLVRPPATEARPVRGSTPPAAGGGAAYLRAKKAAAEAQRAGQDSAARTAQEVYEELSGLAVAGRRLRPQDPRLSGLVGTMILNAAYLVDDAASDSFTSAATRIAEAHPEIETRVDGPWPPYSFIETEEP